AESRGAARGPRARAFDQIKNERRFDERLAAEETEFEHAAAREGCHGAIDGPRADHVVHGAVRLRAGIAVCATEVAGVVHHENQAEVLVHFSTDARRAISAPWRDRDLAGELRRER